MLRNEDPPEINVETPVVFSGEGQEAMLVCIVHGEKLPDVIWFKETMQLDTTERHIMESRGSRHTLIIRKVHPQDFGNYSCVAENPLGKVRKMVTLSGKPNTAIFRSAPVSQYKDRYNISWTVDSHIPIEEFKLFYRRLPQGHDAENTIEQSQPLQQQQHQSVQTYSHRGYGSSMHWRNDWRDVVLPAVPLSHHYTQGMSYMIRGLDPDQQYEAKVQARNRHGWGEMSQSFTFTTSTNDSEMRDLSVTYYGGSTSNSMIFKNCIGITSLFMITFMVITTIFN
ncbi:Titin [Pseudolycoriella hygida]|uniref:Titin n=1 Tax=Pseudolycoriella hygida TaxID=35572 RepID=A0A9Q0MWJ1_9DIPT|nr:Titin [Pseudolycoriella hygida]